MRTIIHRSLFLLSMFACVASAKPELINEKVILETSIPKLSEMTNELYLKTGASIVMHFKAQLPNGDIIAYENNISAQLEKPYVLVVLAAKERKVDIVVSEDLKKVIDKNKILNGFIIPILSAEDKNSFESKYSAAMLNGIAEIADEIADSKNIKLSSSIGSESRYFIQGLRFLFYAIVFGSIAIYAYMAYKRRRA
jgi:hypothetical protein